MGRRYSFSFSGVEITAARTILQLTTPADRMALIHELGVQQLLDVGDAQEEMLLLSIRVGASASTGVTDATEVQFDAGDAAAGAEGAYNGLQAAGSEIQRAYWNIRIPFQHIYRPGLRPVIGPSFRFNTLISAPTDSITIAGYLIWEEIGG